MDPGASAFRLGADCGLRFLDHAPPADASENDVSLVARFETPEGGLLLTGDIEAEAEERLVERYGQALRTSVLKAPHHGSRTSSTPGFLGAVAPSVVVFTTGRDNRWQFPREGIRARYQRRGIAEFDTGRQGLVRLVFEADGPRLTPFRDAGGGSGDRPAGGNLIARNATPE
jgi:competence protein ComEC